MTDLLPEPLYRRTSGGNRVRVHKPSKSLTRRLKLHVYERDGWACVICKRRFEKPKNWDGSQYIPQLELGHIIPYINGGPYTEDNIQAECRQCNQTKKKGA